MWRVAASLLSIKKFQNARSYINDAIDHYSQHDFENSIGLGDCLSLSAEINLEFNDYQKSETQAKSSLEILETEFPPEHEKIKWLNAILSFARLMQNNSEFERLRLKQGLKWFEDNGDATKAEKIKAWINSLEKSTRKLL